MAPPPSASPPPAPVPTCGQPQREEPPGAGPELDDAVADVFGGPFAGLRVRLQDDELHGGGRAEESRYAAILHRPAPLPACPLARPPRDPHSRPPRPPRRWAASAGPGPSRRREEPGPAPPDRRSEFGVRMEISC